MDALHEHVNTQLDLEYTYLSEKLEGEKTRRGGLEERMATLEAEKGAVERKIEYQEFLVVFKCSAEHLKREVEERYPKCWSPLLLGDG